MYGITYRNFKNSKRRYLYSRTYRSKRYAQYEVDAFFCDWERARVVRLPLKRKLPVLG